MNLTKWMILGVFLVMLPACSMDQPKVPPTGNSSTSEPGNTLAVGTAPVEGNTERGAALFKTAHDPLPACSTCHSIGQDKVVGPGLGGISTRAGTRVNGQSA